MKRIFGYFLLIATAMILLSCNTLQAQSTKANLYGGQNLKIGIIGEIPKVREEQIKFEKIQFSDLEKDRFDSQYNAIFITKNNLSEASEEKYKPIYKKSKIPFFFIQSKKSYVPFIQEGLSYEKAPDMPDQTYVTGMLYNGENLKYWGYGLYNDIESQENVKEVYSRIFETISQDIVSNEIKNEGNKIVIEKIVSESNKYEYFNEISDREKVQNVSNVLDSISWDNAKVSMAHPPDYKFHFENINKENKANELIYDLWISPNKNKVELVVESESKYIQLDKKRSSELFEIITGEKLINEGK